ncbi:(2Fe-2S)-binding protein [Nocardioides massiliensis]|uniref:Aerobic-type carbon monoxide dehydrogenase small subunit (CoxS/CutS family) n=1 Tax=Nocardioides massiliensis TaxID=1325935 RepID=A0ABT9NN32_9ACTN|nr:2Fe-2S iron-sulfur cluster-binding protein [Nocardioides massiliensis]MDP9821832.1 aerobic-type carbon monoxide dehydrogenase small subunit (CoxS/CutS family) [Nocardioides massiliensis]
MTLGAGSEDDPTTLVVNGTEVLAPASQSLASVLRDQLGLTATKVACGRGECGACTVLVDGRPTMACVTMAGLVRGPVETLEGLADEISDLREEFADRGAFQCGFCTPGQLVHGAALVRQAGRLAEEGDLPCAVRKRLSGNICRCTGYQAITAALCSVVEQRVEARVEKEEIR